MGPIGVFDSGYGGLTILKDIKEKLPCYDFIYLGDNARAPYGTRSFDLVYKFTLQAVKDLFQRDCELVILACNTSSAKALRSIQQKDLRIIAPNKRVLGVIRPSTEIIGELTKSNSVGLLATQGTVTSNSYVMELNKFSPSTKIYQHACPMWVSLIENNKHYSISGKEIIKNDIEILLEKDSTMDLIILGCTHYPIIKEYIQSIVPKHVSVVSQGQIVADRLSDYLNRHKDIESRCSKESNLAYLTTGDVDQFNANASYYIGEQIKSSHIKLGP